MERQAIIVKNITSFTSFVADIKQNPTKVHSIAMAIDAVALIELFGGHDDPSRVSEGTNQLWQLLEYLGSAIPHLQSLQTFILQVRSRRNGFWLPRPLISDIISKLPTTCTSVEVDSYGCDRGEPGTAHLCETIREILPRLVHLRLDLSTLCANASQVNTRCPRLKALIISCFAGGYYNSRLCDSYNEDPVHSTFAWGKEAVPDLVQGLQAHAHQFPNISQAIICDQSGSNSYGEAFHQTYNLRDVLEDVVTAMPMVRIYPFVSDGNMLRTLDGNVFGSLNALKAVLESDVRMQHHMGKVLPTESEEPERPLGLDEWKAKYPKRRCTLWLNEKKAGRRLGEACVVAGAASRVFLPVVQEVEHDVVL